MYPGKGTVVLFRPTQTFYERIKLPIPEFDPADPLHVAIAEAGNAAADGAAKQLTLLRQNRSRVTVTIARRELRAWLRDSHEGRAVEDAVGRLLEE